LSVAHFRTGSLKVCSQRFEGKTKIRKTTHRSSFIKQQIFPCNNKKTTMFVYDILPLPLLFSYTEVYIKLSNYDDKNNQLKDVKKKIMRRYVTS